jgi:hypothetical protein
MDLEMLGSVMKLGVLGEADCHLIVAHDKNQAMVRNVEGIE